MIMGSLEQLQNPNFWRTHIGLLPIPLRSQGAKTSFVLMNGAEGNFCLQTLGEVDADPRSLAWSSDVGHHLTIRNQTIDVVSWYDRDSFSQSYRIDDVVDRIGDFHAHLEKREPNRDGSIVAHALRVLGQMRQLLPVSFTPEHTIRYFLALLANSAEKDGDGVSAPAWLANSGLSVLDNNALRASEWEMLRVELAQRRPLTELTPFIELLLRHASGTLFQEVHYRIRMPLSLTLPGFAPSPAKVLDRNQDKQAGVYFTPPFLARTLVEESLALFDGPLPSRIKVFDPACGSGEFFKELIRQLSAQGYMGQLDIEGWDISEVALNVSKFVLAFEKANSLPFTLNYEIKTKDSILCPDEDWPTDVDLCLMNPPFAAWTFLKEEYKVRLTGIFGSGKPNLAVAFAKLATRTVKEGGIFSAVLPASVLDAVSARSWREEMAGEFTSSLVAKLGSQSLFTNAIVDANLAIFVRNGNRSLPCRVVWSDQKKSSSYKALRSLRSLTSAKLRSDVVATPAFSVYADNTMGRSGDAWRPISMEVASTLSKYQALPKLSGLFGVEQGARIGEDVFVQPKSYVDALPEAERKYFRPAVVNASIRDGALNDGWYVWFPYTPGIQKIETEEQLSDVVPTYYADKLANSEAKRTPNQSNQSEKRNWWELIRPRKNQITPRPKIMSTYFGGTGSFAYDSSGEFVAVVGYFWVPHKSIAQKFNDEIGFAYVAITCSDIFGKLLEAVSTHIGGGQLKLEKQFMASLPIPNLMDTSVPARLRRALSELGKQITAQAKYSQEELNAVVNEVYSA